jgi:predicted phosphoribosyltransferase
MCEKVLHLLKARRYAYLENINCFGPVSDSYRRLMEIRIAEVTDIINEIEREQKKDDIIIA